MTEAGDTHSIVGTEGYLPPEGPGAPQADIFSLGKVLYEMSTGMDRRRFSELPEDLRSWPDRSAVVEFNEIVLKACAKDPARRYQTAEEMHAELLLLRGGKSIRDRHLRQHHISLARKTGVAIAVVAVIAIGVIFLSQMLARRGASVLPPSGEDPAAFTKNAKAAEAYALGLPGLHRGTTEGFRMARENFTLAIDADPKFVAAVARLFEIYLMSEDHGLVIIDGKRQKLEELSARLVKLDPAGAETHAAIAITLFLNHWKWAEAEQEFKRALERDPKSRMTLTYYGYFLTRLGRGKDALDVLESARKVDPTSPLIAKLLGHCAFLASDYEKALSSYQTASIRDPNYPSSYYWVGRAYLALSNYPQALVEFGKYEFWAGYSSGERARDSREFTKALEDGGVPAYWKKQIDMAKKGDLRLRKPYFFAECYARLGDKAQALDWLEIAFAEHDSIENLIMDEFWKAFRHEKRFNDVLKNVGLDQWAR